MKRALAAASLIVLLPSVSLGQSPANQPAFEIADVHVSAPGTSESGGFMPGGRFELHGTTMLDLITIAYGVESAMVMGGPSWLNSDKFDVIAKAPSAAASQETLQSMLKALLADRFKLVTRPDTRDMPVYVLTVGKNGAKLRPAANPGPAKTSRGEGDPNIPSHLKCESFTMADLIELLPQVARNYVDHPVVDKTGLDGAYDFQLDWMGIGLYRAAKANPDGPAPFSLFDGVEKLGLKLEAQKQPMPVILVDSVNEKPTDNPPGVTSKIPTFPTEFDVAEVRQAKPVAAPESQTGQMGPMGQMDFQNGRVQIMSATLKGLISLAYDMNMERIAGAPKWLAEDRFDIIAKAPATVPFEALRGMLKTLIVQRFALNAHTEDQPMPVYVLAQGKKPKLKESDGAARSDCKIVNNVRRTFVCQNTTMAQFAERLPGVAAAYIHPPVLDLTGLKGAYDFEAYWTPKGQLSAAGKAGDTGQAPTPTDDVTVFEAVDKQLGLKLEDQKHPVPVLVIDKVNRTPREN
jgi:uncharacterized protein (TIGR03435 family)